MTKTIFGRVFTQSQRRHDLDQWRVDSPAMEQGFKPKSFAQSHQQDMINFGVQNYRRIGLTRLFLFVGLLGMIGVVAYFLHAPDALAPSRLERVPTIDSTPGGEHQRESEQYRETLRRSNLTQADKAKESGDSFMPVPEALPEKVPSELPQIQSRQETAAAEISFTAQQVAERVAVATTTAAQRIETERTYSQSKSDQSLEVAGSTQSASVTGDENPYHALILRQMSAITRATEINGQRSVELLATDQGQIGPVEPQDEMAETVLNVHRLSSGMILAGEVVTLIDSDVPSPVTVRVISGHIKDSVLIGRFDLNANSKAVAIEFNRLVVPDGAEFPVQAMAIDPFTQGGAIQGDIDHRPLQRYGPMLVSSFISGFANHATRPATTLSNTAGGLLVTSDKPLVKDNLIAGVGQAANAAATQFVESAPKTPRIRIYPGETVSILLLSPIQIPTKFLE